MASPVVFKSELQLPDRIFHGGRCAEVEDREPTLDVFVDIAQIVDKIAADRVMLFMIEGIEDFPVDAIATNPVADPEQDAVHVVRGHLVFKVFLMKQSWPSKGCRCLVEIEQEAPEFFKELCIGLGCRLNERAISPRGPEE